ncbi:MAG: hypothetical protein QXL27_09605 [Candidatus Bathyarchaeia archaeon]
MIIVKKLLLPILIVVIIMMNYLALAKPSDKMDIELQAVLEMSNPSEPIGVIVVFHEEPTEDQIDALRTVHKMNISYVYKIIHAIAGKAPAGEIPKIAEYDWVKEIWLDKKVYVTEDKAVETSQLIDKLQGESEELKQAVSNLNREIANLQEQVQAQQKQISQLEENLKMYPSIAFTTGLAVGVVATTLVMRLYKQKTSVNATSSTTHD